MWRPILVFAIVVAGCSTSSDQVETVVGPSTSTAPTAPSTLATTPSPTTLSITISPGLATEACEPTADESFTADLDGDGVVETLQGVFDDRNNITITVCGTALVVEPLVFEATNKPRNFYFVDIEGDGPVEMFTGGLGGPALHLEVVRLSDGRLVESGQSVHNSLDLGNPGPDGLQSFGCVDVDGDGRSELVRLEYELVGVDELGLLESATAMHWTRTVLLPGGREGQIDRGTFELPAQIEQARVVTRRTCGDTML